LDCGTGNPTIYVWNGPKSSPAKKTKGAAVAEILKNHERNGHATIIKLDASSDDPEFWKALGGGSVKDVPDKWSLGSDEYPIASFSTHN
jgi:Gelsolin repeat